MGKNKHIHLALALAVIFAISRIPGLMPENFSAAYALAYCAGLYFPGAMAWWFPLGAMFVTDIVLNIFYYHVSAITPFILAVYLCYGLLVLLGKKFRQSNSFIYLLSGGILGALLFYIITNTISWLADPGYQKNLAGWIQALTTGLPGYPPTWVFFKNTLLSGGLFTGLFVGSMKIAEATSEKEETEETEEGETEPASEKTAS
ncbi:MAG: hypothetical protein N2487_04850 [Verrucomicrobiae bacterium]|nr:hypothetical protein [Verrucomicrobiae bacterium]